MIPNPLIFDIPLNVWLGLLAFLLLVLQILIGARVLKLPFWFHTRVVWILLLVVVLIHGLIGFQRYFLN